MKESMYIALLMCVACVNINDSTPPEVNEPIAEEVQGNTIILNHSLIHHHLSIIRNKNTESSEFRTSLGKISEMLILEATKDLPTVAVQTETPVAKTTCFRINPKKRIFVVPILRAGLAISYVAEDIIPGVVIQHIGMYRDEKTHKPVWYYNKLPSVFANPSDIKVIICDPMLATGGSAYEAIKMYIDKGITEENITFVCIIAAPEGVAKLRSAFPKIKIIMAHLDRNLNSKAYIVPGLGDAGDRLFNTQAEVITSKRRI
jgi:uracil phosphoribosyltransferase